MRNLIDDGKSHVIGEHAGSGGFDLKVEGKTDLKGGLITSEAAEDKNRLETGTLTWSDLETKSEWDVSSVGGRFTIGTDKDRAKSAISLGRSSSPILTGSSRTLLTSTVIPPTPMM